MSEQKDGRNNAGNTSGGGDVERPDIIQHTVTGLALASLCLKYIGGGPTITFAGDGTPLFVDHAVLTALYSAEQNPRQDWSDESSPSDI